MLVKKPKNEGAVNSRGNTSQPPLLFIFGVYFGRDVTFCGLCDEHHEAEAILRVLLLCRTESPLEKYMTWPSRFLDTNRLIFSDPRWDDGKYVIDT